MTGRRDDGYHLLDSLVVFADVGDTLTFTRADTYSLEITGPFAGTIAPEPDNLVFKAAAQLGELAPGAAISLNKALPVAAGIGGGSADAAATLRGLLGLYSIVPSHAQNLDEIALALGADVPACLRSKALRMSGIGEHISAIEPFPALPAVLVNPGVAVPTGSIFKALNLDQPSLGADGLSPLPTGGFGSANEVVHWLEHQRNDLQGPALAIAPDVGEVLDAIKSAENCRLARMSGSGATCFGLFDTAAQADAFAATLASRKPHWWVVSTLFQ